MSGGLLDGVRVLSMAHLYPGPYCTLILGDLGAEIILVEQPGIGDASRALPLHFGAINRNKRSITLNLKVHKGRDICYQLVKNCDVFLEGFRPGVASRLGVGYETIRDINPHIIYCSISGYGQDGPYRDWPAHDNSYQGIAGLLKASGGPSPPNILEGVAIGDLSSGMFATIGILAALYARNKLGIGQYIDVSMLDSLVALMSIPLYGYLTVGSSFRVRTDAAYGVFETKERKHITLSISGEQHFWRNLCVTIGREDLAEMSFEERLERHDELMEMLRKTIATRESGEWIKVLIAADVPCGPVMSLEEVVRDPQVLHRRMITEIDGVRQIAHPLKFSNARCCVDRPVPKLGEHTRDILKSLGYTEQDVETLRKEGVV
jgi:crotonobetainyl-CoA:carnitine CoA-transferase CaiB-like acyl-CoA transferase